MVKTIGLLAFAALLFMVGICCLRFPEWLQAIAVKRVNWGSPSKVEMINGYMRLVDKFVQSNQYLMSLRIIGILSLLCCFFLLWAWIETEAP